jgi:chaperonin GroES
MAPTSKTKISFTPLEDRVLICPDESEGISAGGIVLPDNAKEKPQRGKIVAAGPGKLNKKGERLPMPVAVGDSVIYGKFAGNDIEIEGEDYKVLHADEILAKIVR